MWNSTRREDACNKFSQNKDGDKQSVIERVTEDSQFECFFSREYQFYMEDLHQIHLDLVTIEENQD